MFLDSSSSCLAFNRFLYPLELSLKDKIACICKEIYGADGVDFSEVAERRIEVSVAQILIFDLLILLKSICPSRDGSELHQRWVRRPAHLHGEDSVLAEHGPRRKGSAHRVPRARQGRARRCGRRIHLP